MTEKDVVRILRAYIETQFPKKCPACGYRYRSLQEYLTKTEHQGDPISYDADMNKWRPRKPLGTMSMANCTCGNTLVISSHAMALVTQWRLLMWARKASKDAKITIRVLLSRLREQIDAEVLGNRGDGNFAGAERSTFEKP